MKSRLRRDAMYILRLPVPKALLTLRGVSSRLATTSRNVVHALLEIVMLAVVAGTIVYLV